MLPKTQYEISGGTEWTSVEDGDALLQTMSTDTGFPVEIIGQSELGENLYKITIGTGDKTILITSGVHGTEPASREAILMKMRDLAYNVDSKYTDYLSEHKVVIAPTMNPDRMHRSYRNALGIDINRGIYPLDSTEAIAFSRMLMDVNPDIHADFHERSGALDQIEYVRAMYIDVNSDLTVRSSIMDALDFIMSGMRSKGHTAEFYPDYATGFGSLTSGSGILGHITFTTETNIDTPMQSRMELHLENFELVLEWHKNNAVLIQETKDNFMRDMIKPHDDFIILNPGVNTYYQSSIHVPITIPEGYILDNPAEFSLWENVYNIQVNEDGFVPINQQTGRMLPHLLDPQSEHAVVTATRVEPPESPRVNGRWTKVLYDEWRDVFVRYM